MKEEKLKTDQQNAKLQDLIKTLETEKSNAVKRVLSLEKTNSGLEKENKIYDIKVKQLEQKRAKLAEKCEDLATKAEVDVASLRSQLEEAQKSKDNAGQQSPDFSVKTVFREMKKMRDQMESTHQKLENLEKEMYELKANKKTVRVILRNDSDSNKDEEDDDSDSDDIPGEVKMIKKILESGAFSLGRR